MISIIQFLLLIGRLTTYMVASVISVIMAFGIVFVLTFIFFHVMNTIITIF